MGLLPGVLNFVLQVLRTFTHQLQKFDVELSSGQVVVLHLVHVDDLRDLVAAFQDVLDQLLVCGLLPQFSDQAFEVGDLLELLLLVFLFLLHRLLLDARNLGGSFDQHLAQRGFFYHCPALKRLEVERDVVGDRHWGEIGDCGNVSESLG